MKKTQGAGCWGWQWAVSPWHDDHTGKAASELYSHRVWWLYSGGLKQWLLFWEQWRRSHPGNIIGRMWFRLMSLANCLFSGMPNLCQKNLSEVGMSDISLSKNNLYKSIITLLVLMLHFHAHKNGISKWPSFIKHHCNHWNPEVHFYDCACKFKVRSSLVFI